MNFLLNYLDEVRGRLSALPDGELLLSDYTPTTKSLKFRIVESHEKESLSFIPMYFIQHFANK